MLFFCCQQFYLINQSDQLTSYYWYSYINREERATSGPGWNLRRYTGFNLKSTRPPSMWSHSNIEKEKTRIFLWETLAGSVGIEFGTHYWQGSQALYQCATFPSLFSIFSFFWYIATHFLQWPANLLHFSITTLSFHWPTPFLAPISCLGSIDAYKYIDSAFFF